MSAPVSPLILMDLINVQAFDLQSININVEHISSLNTIKVNENVFDRGCLTAIAILGVAISPFALLMYHYGREFKM